MGPVNTIEIAFAIVFLLASSLINALMFSEIVVLIQGLDKTENAIQEFIDGSN